MNPKFRNRLRPQSWATGVDRHPLSTHQRLAKRPLHSVGRTRIGVKLTGYIRNRWFAESIDDFEFESATFNPTLVLEV